MSRYGYHLRAVTTMVVLALSAAACSGAGVDDPASDAVAVRPCPIGPTGSRGRQR